MDSVDIWWSDSIFGGEGRHEVLRSEYYLLLDVRPDSVSVDTTAFIVTSEHCAGWPCQHGDRVVVRRDSTGFIAEHLQSIFIE